jgi:hypothetical protein
MPSKAFPNRPTLSEQQFVAGGRLQKWNPPGSDIMFAHPFGNDYSMDLALSPADFLSLNYVKPGTGNVIPLHVEIENGLFPYQDFGWGVPQVNDSVLVQGDWIMDCGHPDSYQSEIHPPSFLAFARQQNSTSTTSMAFASPYRTTQLYNPNETLANAFTNLSRFASADTKPFQAHLADEVSNVLFKGSQHLEAHVLVEPNDFGVLNWSVCAPTPKPAGASLKFSYHFTERTGIAVQATSDDATGCVHFYAVQGPSYTPASATRNTVTWSWADINAAASAESGKPVDVKARIYDTLHSSANYLPYVGIDNDPLIDSYPALHPRPGADLDTPVGITQSADDQPFPFYGRATVSWNLRATFHPSGATDLAANPPTLSWYPAATGPRSVTITNRIAVNSPSTTYILGQIALAGSAASDYTIQSDSCSGATLAAGSQCQITIDFKPGAVGSREAAISIIDNQGVAQLVVPLTAPGLIS